MRLPSDSTKGEAVNTDPNDVLSRTFTSHPHGWLFFVSAGAHRCLGVRIRPANAPHRRIADRDDRQAPKRVLAGSLPTTSNGRTAFPYCDVAGIVVGIVVGILGVAFALVCVGDRLNNADFLWGVGHICLSVAVFLGYRYRQGLEAWMDGVSLVATAVFLVTLHAANRALANQSSHVPSLAWQAGAVLSS